MFLPTVEGRYILLVMYQGFDINDPLFVFGLTLAVILIVPLLFQRIRIPGLIGLILAGVVLGPHAFGLIHDESIVQPIGSMGLLYLMFLAGLEVDMYRFRKEKHNSFVFGGITFLIPQLLGMLGAWYFLGLPWAAAILMASMFASHTLLPYPIAQRLGLVKERVVTTVVGGTVLTDSLALLVLAVVAESATGELTPAFWTRLVVLLLVYAGVVIWSVPRLGRWFFKRVSSESIPGFIFVLVLAYGCSVTAPLAGLEPIIGAFLAGLTLNMLIPEHSRLMVRLRFVGESLFIPFFLISVGLRVNLNLLIGSEKAWLVMLFMVVAGYVTKFLAALLSGKILDFSRDETGVMFGLSVNQAGATLAAVIVGVRLGIFSEDVLNGTILMILATCTLGPWVTEKYGRRLALCLSSAHMDSSGAPERIMIPVSSPEQIEPLMSLALMVRGHWSGQPLYPTMITTDEDESEEAVASAEKMLAEAVIMAVEGDTPVQPVTRVSSMIVDGLMGACRDLRISTVIMDEEYSAPGELENLPDLFVEKGRHLILRFMNPTLVNTFKRLLVAVPPLMEKQPGFSSAWELILRIKSQAGTDLLVLAEIPTIESLKSRSELDTNAPGTGAIPVGDWHKLPDIMENTYREGDLPVLLLARLGRLAWQPVQARLPGVLNRVLNSSPMLQIFPPEMKWEKEVRVHSPAEGLQEVFSEDSVFLNMSERSLDEAVEYMVATVFAESNQTKEMLMNDLHDQLDEKLLKLSSDCVLLHTHKATKPAPMALLATSREGFAGKREEDEAKVLILLLGTSDESPEEHLRRLARIASLFHDRELIKSLLSAERYEDMKTQHS